MMRVFATRCWYYYVGCMRHSELSLNHSSHKTKRSALIASKAVTSFMKIVHNYQIQFVASTVKYLACTHPKHNWKLDAAPVELDFYRISQNLWGWGQRHSLPNWPRPHLLAITCCIQSSLKSYPEIPDSRWSYCIFWCSLRVRRSIKQLCPTSGCIPQIMLKTTLGIE